MFFFKQKTAYELRIRYWSSDVSSSDLETNIGLPVEADPSRPLAPLLLDRRVFGISGGNRSPADQRACQQNLRWNGGERLSVLGVAKTRRQFQVVADIIIEFAEQRRGRELVRILGPEIIMSVAVDALDRIGVDIGAHRQGGARSEKRR